VRQRNLKVLVARADAKWASKPSFLDAPGRGNDFNQLPAVAGVKDAVAQSRSGTSPKLANEGVMGRSAGGGGGNVNGGTEINLDDTVEGSEAAAIGKATEQEERRAEEKRKSATMAEQKHKEDPWKKAGGGPSEGWQPQSWTGTSAKRL
jgi:NADH dehydrogenase [ubiquinone] 1 alpha subcomplex assembly factor 2